VAYATVSLGFGMDTLSAIASDVEVRPSTALSSLMRKIPYIIVTTALVAIFSYQYLSAVVPRYTAQATILIDTGGPDPGGTSGDSRVDALVDQGVIAGQVQIIRSRDLARSVASALDLSGRPEFDPALRQTTFLESFLGAFGLHRNPGDRSIEERVLESYEDRLSVYAVNGSGVIAVDFTSTDPELAALAANAVADRYVALQRQARDAATAVAGDAIAAEIVSLRTKLDEAEGRIEAFRSENDLPSDGSAVTVPPVAPETAQLFSELDRVRAQKAEAEASAARIGAALDAGSTANLTDTLSAPLLTRLVAEQANLRARISEEAATLLPQHPRMKELAAQLADLDRQIDDEGRKLLKAANGEALRATTREREILDSLSPPQIAAIETGDAESELQRLNGEAAELRASLEARLSRYRAALSERKAGFLPVAARVLSRAVAPINPSTPRPALATAALAGLALVLATIFVFLREWVRQRSFRRSVFGETLPEVDGRSMGRMHAHEADGEGARWMADSEPTLVPEVVDRVEESLVAIALQIVEQQANCVLVTLADGSDTGSRPLVGVALARAIAQTDARVVLVDLRDDGASSQSMGEDDDLPGFSDLFAGAASFAQVIFRDHQSRVHFIAAGHAPVSAGMLGGERLETLLSALTLTYDFVLLDAPDPLVQVLAPAAAAAVVVSEHGAADSRTIRAIERLDAVPPENTMLLVVDPEAEPAEGDAPRLDNRSPVELA
jgi:tyrosine-protein kinase Etk/Wzc